MKPPTDAPSAERQDHVDAAITSRRSVRAFLPTSVPNEVVRQILATAARAPSGTNIQPWRVFVLTGNRLKQLSDAILAAYNDPKIGKTHTEAYPYYPKEWVSPYIERRRKIGWDLYGLLGITREDKDKMRHQHGRNSSGGRRGGRRRSRSRSTTLTLIRLKEYPQLALHIPPCCIRCHMVIEVEGEVRAAHAG